MLWRKRDMFPNIYLSEGKLEKLRCTMVGVMKDFKLGHMGGGLHGVI